MSTIEEYAIGIVASGAESTIEDDLNEDGEVTDDDHPKACALALAIVRAIRANPGEILALARLTADLEPEPCPTCNGRIRETVGMVCRTCGHDYAADDPQEPAEIPSREVEDAHREGFGAGVEWAGQHHEADEECYGLTVEQEIRSRLAVALLTDMHVLEDDVDGEGLAAELIEFIAPIARFVATGSPAEPALTPGGDGAAADGSDQ
jgi:hypothetical protein